MSPNKQTNILALEQYRPEIQTQLELELQNIKEGRLNDAILIKAMAFNVPFNEFMSVAKKRGKKWGFLSALSDVALEINAIGMLYLIKYIVGQNTIMKMTEKAMAGVDFMDVWEFRSDGNPHKTALIAIARRGMEEGFFRCISGCWNDVMKKDEPW